MSLALYEEIELLTGALLAIFNAGDKWAALDYVQFQQVKDTYCNSLLHLFSMLRMQQNFETVPASTGEQLLDSIFLDKDLRQRDLHNKHSCLYRWQQANFREEAFNLSGFELKIEISKVKAYLNIGFSMLSIALINKEARNGLELIGNPIVSRVQKQVFQRDMSASLTVMGNKQNWVDAESEVQIYRAVENILYS
mmetsp:Transcript_23470/g.23126  ORF Transcript_23470/g.23126 Transcript_23470/m.23126 type:complete len:195 (+) Transcript_23470:1009-1593(+)